MSGPSLDGMNAKSQSSIGLTAMMLGGRYDPGDAAIIGEGGKKKRREEGKCRAMTAGWVGCAVYMIEEFDHASGLRRQRAACLLAHCDPEGCAAHLRGPSTRGYSSHQPSCQCVSSLAFPLDEVECMSASFSRR
jgi:hypothetical protein